MFTDHKNGLARGRAIEPRASSCFGGKWAPELGSLDPGPCSSPLHPSRKKRHASSTLSVLWAVPESSLICLNQGETRQQPVTGFSSIWSADAPCQEGSRSPDPRAALSPPSRPGGVSVRVGKCPTKPRLPFSAAQKAPCVK